MNALPEEEVLTGTQQLLVLVRVGLGGGDCATGIACDTGDATWAMWRQLPCVNIRAEQHVRRTLISD
jgi:hypothetical protein